jgi:hypothetical protein
MAAPRIAYNRMLNASPLASLATKRFRLYTKSGFSQPASHRTAEVEVLTTKKSTHLFIQEPLWLLELQEFQPRLGRLYSRLQLLCRKTGKCHVTRASLAEMIGVGDKRWVSYMLTRLCELRLIEIRRRRRASAEYRILEPDLAWIKQELKRQPKIQKRKNLTKQEVGFVENNGINDLRGRFKPTSRISENLPLECINPLPATNLGAEILARNVLLEVNTKTPLTPPLSAAGDRADGNHKNQNPRQRGTSPRQRGTSPRQRGTSPRQQGTSPRQLHELVWDYAAAHRDALPVVPRDELGRCAYCRGKGRDIDGQWCRCITGLALADHYQKGLNGLGNTS